LEEATSDCPRGGHRRSGLRFARLAQSQTPTSDQVRFRQLYKELVEINTTLSFGSCTAEADAMAARLKAAGLPTTDVQVLAPADRPNDGALIATLRGHDRQAKPILLLGV
jgi:hypothetical protein